MVPAVVTPELAGFALDLGAVREREVWEFVAEQVEAVDLVENGGLLFVVEVVDELADRLVAVAVAVVDGSEVRQAAVCADGSLPTAARCPTRCFSSPTVGLATSTPTAGPPTTADRGQGSD